MRSHSLVLAYAAAAQALTVPARPENHPNENELRRILELPSSPGSEVVRLFSTNGRPHDKREEFPLSLPTIADWWTLDTPTFLQSYLNTTAVSNATGRSRFASLARCYGLVDLPEQSNSTAHDDECSNLRSELGTEDSVHAEMVLAALTNFASTLELIIDSAGGGFRGAGMLIEDLPYTSRWWKKFPKEEKAKLAQENTISIVRDSFLSGMPWLTPEAWQATATLAHDEASKIQAVAGVVNVEAGATSPSLNKWDQLFGTQVDLKFLDETRRTTGYHPAMGRDNPEIMRIASGGVELAEKIQNVVLGAQFAKAQESTWNAFFTMAKAAGKTSTLKPRAVEQLDTVSPKDFFGATAMLAQRSIKRTVGRLFNGTLEMDGGIFELLEYGNLLSASEWATARVREALPEMIARRLYNRALNYALAEDQVYITCTVLEKDDKKPPFGKYVEGSTCYHDRTGPQDMKACLDNEHVCYLYRWKEPASKWKPWIKAHSDKPAGVAEWGAAPHLTQVSDIIVSSVATKLQGLKDFRLLGNDKPLLAANWTSLTDIGKASAPGVFNVPVCYSEYSWNTPLEIARERKGWLETPCAQGDPYCHELALPCYCGQWGSETMDVWNAIGHVAKSRDSGARARKVCGKLIKKKISHPIEAYVAYCRLDIRRAFGWTWSNRVNGIITVNGKDDYCDDVLQIIRVNGYDSIASMDPEAKYAIYCKILGDGGRCNMYKAQWGDLLAGKKLGDEPGPRPEVGEGVLEQGVEKYESDFASMVMEANSDDEE